MSGRARRRPWWTARHDRFFFCIFLALFFWLIFLVLFIGAGAAEAVVDSKAARSLSLAFIVLFFVFFAAVFHLPAAEAVVDSKA